MLCTDQSWTEMQQAECLCPPNPYVEILTFSLMVLGAGALVIKVESFLVKSLPCEDRARRQQSETKKRVPMRTLPCWHPDLRLSVSRSIRNKFCCLNILSIIFLLQQTDQNKTRGYMEKGLNLSKQLLPSEGLPANREMSPLPCRGDLSIHYLHI